MESLRIAERKEQGLPAGLGAEQQGAWEMTRCLPAASLVVSWTSLIACLMQCAGRPYVQAIGLATAPTASPAQQWITGH